MKRQWETYDAYLFDIDGTLLKCKDAVHYFAFCHALTCVAGTPLNLEGVVAHGNVDIGILRDAFSIRGVPESLWRPKLPELQDIMCRFVEERKGELCVSVLPGARELLTHLAMNGALLGVATGNFAAIGRAKLAQGGLLANFSFGGFSDGYEFRADVVCGALQQARELVGPRASVCLVGDTPEDVRAAKANGMDVIAVASGIYSPDELRRESPTMLIASLEELTA